MLCCSVIFFLCAYKVLIIMAFCLDLKIEIMIAICDFKIIISIFGRNGLRSM